MIVFEFEKEDIGYAERISDLAEMSLLIEDPKSFSSDLNTVIQIGVELAPYAITGITLIIVELIKFSKSNCFKIKVLREFNSTRKNAKTSFSYPTDKKE